MQDGFQFADNLGPFKVVHVYEPSVKLKGVLVIDNVAQGPSIGGLRMAPDVSTEECFRLARAMTLKNAAAGIPHGGGKAVIYGDPNMPKTQKTAIIRAFAHALRHDEEYIFGPDIGTNEECMAWIRDEIGRSVGLPRELGGIPLDEIGATGRGLSHAAEVAVEHCDFSMDGARIVIQGFGSVGKNTARYLTKKGAILIAASDSQGAIYNKAGLSVETLCEHKRNNQSVINYPDGTQLDHNALLEMECEIWIPAARPDVIHKDNVGRLRTKLLLEGANIPVTEEAERTLFRNGVMYIPDFIANAGGVICAALEYQGESQSTAIDIIEEKVRRNTEQVLFRVKNENIEPRQAAVEMALKHLHAAMSYRRFSLSSSAPRAI